MDSFKYKQPDDIPVHFLGETQVSVRKLQQERRVLQCICFIIFRMVEMRDRNVGRYTIEVKNEYGRSNIRLFAAEKRLFELLEDCFHEWVAKQNGTDNDLLDFMTEYLVYINQSYKLLPINRFPKSGL